MNRTQTAGDAGLGSDALLAAYQLLIETTVESGTDDVLLQRALAVLVAVPWPSPHRFFLGLPARPRRRLVAPGGDLQRVPPRPRRPAPTSAAASCLCGRALIQPGAAALHRRERASAGRPPCDPRGTGTHLILPLAGARSRAGRAAHAGRIGAPPRQAGAVLPDAGRDPPRGRTAPPPQRAGARPARNAVSPGAEDGGRRPSRRRRGARFQQHPHGDHQLRGSRPAQAAGGEPAAPQFRGDHRRLRPRRAADAATPRVLAPPGAGAARHRRQRRHRRTGQDAAPAARVRTSSFRSAAPARIVAHHGRPGADRTVDHQPDGERAGRHAAGGGDRHCDRQHRTRREPTRSATPRSPRGRTLCLAVSAHGPGMAADYLDALGGPGSAPPEPHTGVTLGPAAVNDIIQQGGGHAQIETSPAAGTTVRICFPAVERRSRRDARPGQHLRPAARRRDDPARGGRRLGAGRHGGGAARSGLPGARGPRGARGARHRRRPRGAHRPPADRRGDARLRRQRTAAPPLRRRGRTCACSTSRASWTT